MSKGHRKKNGRRFAAIPLDVLQHIAVSTLDHASFRVMVLLAGQYAGFNNGAVGITWGQAEAAGVGSKNTLYGALKTLEDRGLIEKTYPASRVPPRPAMYALAWQPVDNTAYTKAAAPTREFVKWTPPQ